MSKFTAKISTSLLMGTGLLLTLAAPQAAFADDVMGQWLRQSPSPQIVVSQAPSYTTSKSSYVESKASHQAANNDVMNQWLRQSPQYVERQAAPIVTQATTPSAYTTQIPVDHERVGGNWAPFDQFVR